MNRRERLERCYANQEVDRPAVYSRTGVPGGDPTYDQLKSYLQAHTELKASWSEVRWTGYPTESRREPLSEDFERQVTVLHTPKGYLEASYLVSLKGQPGFQETYFLKTPEDADKYLALPLPEVLEADIASFAAIKARMGDTGIVEASLGMSPAGVVATLLGTEAFAVMSMTDRDVLHALCERQLTIALNRTRFLLEHDIGPFFSMLGEEYVVPPIHGPADFQDFVVKYEKPIIDRIHDADGYVHVHCHASIKKVFQGFLDMGVDVLHPFEAPPMGDITPAEAKSLSRGKLCLEGNIQIHRMYEASPQELRDETQKLIDATFDDRRGLIVCPTASPYIRGEGETSFPQYKAMIDTVLAYGR